MTITDPVTGQLKRPAEGSAWIPRHGQLIGEQGKRWDIRVADDGTVHYRRGTLKTGPIYHTPLGRFWDWVALTGATEVSPPHRALELPWAARVAAVQERAKAEAQDNVVPFRRRTVAASM